MTANGPTPAQIADAEIQINEMVRILKKQRDTALAAEVDLSVKLAIAEARARRAEALIAVLNSAQQPAAQAASVTED